MALLQSARVPPTTAAGSNPSDVDWNFCDRGEGQGHADELAASFEGGPVEADGRSVSRPQLAGLVSVACRVGGAVTAAAFLFVAAAVVFRMFQGKGLKVNGWLEIILSPCAVKWLYSAAALL